MVRQAVASSEPGGVGIEVDLGTQEGLRAPRVVRVALPQEGHILCTWLVTLTRESLVDRAGVLSSTKLDQLATALRLAQVA